jgi:hypothetical protein
MVLYLVTLHLLTAGAGAPEDLQSLSLPPECVSVLIVSNDLRRNGTKDLARPTCKTELLRIREIRSRRHNCVTGPVRSGTGFIDITYDCKP